MPQSEERVMHTVQLVSPPSPTSNSPRNGSRILVVDDEMGIRLVFELQLQRDGHRVTCAENGVEALHILRSGDFDLLITDLEMPEMSGYELIRHVQQLWPTLPIFICSGTALDTSLPADIRAAASGLLQKPITVRELSAAVEAFLGAE
jgi:CheY-like chemotaxis protein